MKQWFEIVEEQILIDGFSRVLPANWKNFDDFLNIPEAEHFSHLSANGMDFDVYIVKDEEKNLWGFGIYPQGGNVLICQITFERYEVLGKSVWSTVVGLYNPVPQNRPYLKIGLINQLMKMIASHFHVLIVNSRELTAKGEKFWREASDRLIDLRTLTRYAVADIGKTINGVEVDDPKTSSENPFFFLIEGVGLDRFGSPMCEAVSRRIGKHFPLVQFLGRD